MSEEELYNYVLYKGDYYEEVDMDGYHVEKIFIGFSDNKHIHLNINMKSNETTLTDAMINGKQISMDYLIVKTFVIPREEFNIFQRSKKITKLKDGIL